MSSHPPELTLYTAPGCCLCAELQGQLQVLSRELPFRLREVDITGDPELERRYRAELPVLLVNGRKAVKYRISTEALRQRLLRASGQGWLGMFRLR
jgi:hypothetical protein